ncbi:SDR family NAD(P)-dependent oxidoreductase [Streptomyces sp. 6N223]|uniref:SDR family NAD(P)-dependent oxidoreductase n=1 Tax=Streptomyces sp. 6N223 TaxID=3457412 RepID=UPI003FCFE8A0
MNSDRDRDKDKDAADEAVAIIGVACRLPGGIADLGGLWGVLREGRDMVGEAPADRFDETRFVDAAGRRPGRSYTRAGGFLGDVGAFDAAYFGISPAEARYMDPQQRLLLEMTAEALDDAGLNAESLAGSDTCVFVGIGDQSYGQVQMMRDNASSPHLMTGALPCVAANRISHAYDLRGPSMAIDTACSSSLVALDRACRTVLDGTSRLAVAAGVNVLLSPFGFVGFSQAAMLSPRGRCAAFSAEADGFVRAEGGGVLILKPLREAIADGDRVHGVLAGTGTNCDGHTRGLPLPSAAAQEDLLRAVYERARVGPDDLVYFEAHGTGTQAGDPAEAEAIGRALARRRSRGPLPVGSVKSNLGHLETASGIAGVLKALLVLRHGTAPATLHAAPLNPRIDFAGLGLAPTVEPCPLARHERAAVGVNSFGFGGANAHAIVAAPPAGAPAPPRPSPPAGPLPVVVSARSAAALEQLAAKVAARLAEAAPEEYYDLAHTTCRRRSPHHHRAAVLAAGPRDAAAQLDRLLGGEPAAGAIARRARATGHARVAFVFSGNASQWPGMAADLLAAEPAFRAAVEEADAALLPLLGWSVADELRKPDAERWRSTEVAQPALFAVQAGLVALLAARGLRPELVIGHSVGEIAAAHAAGALDLAGAARVIAVRGRAQAATAGRGRMAAVGLPEDRAREELAGFGGALEIAGVNSDQDVTVAGPADALARLGDRLREREVFFRELDLDHAFHSAAMEPVREALTTGLAGLAPRAGRVPLVSTVTGAPVAGEDLTAAYWWRNVREPVRFADAVGHALRDGADVFVEIGPHPVLRSYLSRATVPDSGAPAGYVPTLRRDGDGPRETAAAVAALLAAHAPVSWEAYFPRPGRVADLPAYPWQRERHWESPRDDWNCSSFPVGASDHPLLGDRLPSPHPTWEGTLEPQRVPWLGDHRVVDRVLMPGAAYLAMALTAGRLALDTVAEIRHLELLRPLPVDWPDPDGLRLSLALTPDDGTCDLSGRQGRSGQPSPLARGRVRALLDPAPAPLDAAGLAALRARCPEELDGPGFYAACRRIGLQLGPAFQTITRAWLGEREYLAAYRAPESTAGDGAHTVLLDAGLQLGALLIAAEAGEERTFLPSAFGAVRVWGGIPGTGFVRLVERGRTATEVRSDITWFGEDGTVHAAIEDFTMRRLSNADHTPLTVQRTVLRAAPLPGERCAPSPLPAPAELASAAAERLTALRDAWHATGPDRFAAARAEACAHAWGAALAGLLPEPAEPFRMSALVVAGLQPRHRRLVRLVLPLLARHGLAERAGGDRWRLTTTDFRHDDLLRALVEDHPAHLAESHLLVREARHLPAALRGTAASAPRRQLAPREVPHEAAYEQFCDVAPARRHAHRVAQALLREALTHWPGDRPLRIVELGAGTGGLTAALLPLLPPERTAYTCTDASAQALTRLEHRFADYDFVDCRGLDPDADLASQGFPDGSCDLVVAGDALHTARDLSAALRRVAALLAPGGHLLAVESHDPLARALAFGTLDDLWRRADHDLRPVSQLLPAEEWPPLLAGTGFAGPVQLGEGEITVLLAAAGPEAERRAEPGAEPGDEPGGEPAADTAGPWLVVAETEAESYLCRALADRLPGPAQATTAAALPAPAPPAAVVLVLAEHEDQVTEVTTRRAALLRSLAGHGDRLWLVTRPTGLLPAPERPTHPVDAAAWAVARTLANEHPDLTVRRISFDRDGDRDRDGDGDGDGGTGRLAAELLAPTDEDEVVLTPAGRFVPRHTQHPADRLPAAPAAATAFVLEAADPGLDYRLAWRETAVPRPGRGELLLQVRAVGLNYRDAMRANGLLPLGDRALGMECAGVVLDTGPGVTGYAPGDRVAALGDGKLASHATVTADECWPLPDGVADAEAATLPVVLFTVHHVLTHQARLAPGETLLVHGAAGGVGLAVLQYARARGAEVIATAGSEAKRELLRSLGVRHVLDSRSLEFAARVRDVTGGRGIDVVVNSLGGEAISRGLELLRPGGRFLEIGKRDILRDSTLPLGPFRAGLAFFSFDLSEFQKDSEAGRALREEILPLLRDGTYRPLPHTVYPAARVQEAFRLLQHSRHTGKIVVSFDPLDEPVPVVPAPAALALDPDGTYLVTGGLGGFGAATAAWLAERGARRLALTGRRGEAAPEAAAVLDGLRARGVTATAHAADVTDPAAMRRVRTEIDATGHPLRGVVHAAAHYDDAPLADLDGERFARVMAPKATGAAVLSGLLPGSGVTRGAGPGLFLLHSSVTAGFGNLRQAPYVAGNAYLEALARARRAAGQAGTAVAWGPIADTGHVARTGLADTLSAMGFEPLTCQEAFAAAERLLGPGTSPGTGPAVAGVGRCQWLRAAHLMRTLRAPRYAALVPAHLLAADDSRDELLRSLATLSPDEAHATLLRLVGAQLAAVLGMDAAHIDPHRPLDQFGVDSLMAAQLLLRLRDEFDVHLSPLDLTTDVTPARLARLLYDRLTGRTQ